MRYILLPISFLALLFTNNLFAAEKLNILGLTLDMTIEELYKKIEPYNKSTGASSNQEDAVKLSSGYGYVLSERGDRESILVVAPELGSNEKPIQIMRKLSTGLDDDYLFQHTMEALIEKFGEPQFQEYDNHDGDNLIAWGNGKNIEKCDPNEKYEYQEILDNCDYFLTVDLRKKSDYISETGNIAQRDEIVIMLFTNEAFDEDKNEGVAVDKIKTEMGLEILGLTLDMTIEELYEKIESYNESVGATSVGTPYEAFGFYVYKLSTRKGEWIQALTSTADNNQPPGSINWRIYTDTSNHDTLFDYVKQVTREMFGKPQYTDTDRMMWTSDRNNHIKKCDLSKYERFKEFEQSATGVKVDCYAILEVEYVDEGKERYVDITLENLKAMQIHELRAAANREKPKF